MNPPIFIVSMVGKDQQEFPNEVYKVLSSMGVICREKAEFDSYQLRDYSKIWYTQLKDNWLEESGLGKYFPQKKREVKL